MSTAPTSELPGPIRTVAQPRCPICSTAGTRVYHGLTDLLYAAPGRWDMSRCDNPACRALWLDEMPHPDDLWMAYRNYYTHATVPDRFSLKSRMKRSFARRGLGYPAANRPWSKLGDVLIHGFFPRAAESAYYQHLYVPWQPGGRLLEIGCGSGSQLLTLQEAGWAVFGVDFDPAAVETARSSGLDVRLGDVRDMNFADQSFDAIVMGHVIEHVYDPVGLLRECRRLITTAGRIVVVTPNAASLGHRTFKESWRGLEPPRHIVVFTPKALRLAFHLAGLRPEATRFSARDAAGMLQTSAEIRRAMRGKKAVTVSRAVSNWHLRRVAGLERLGAWGQRNWAEEQILVGRRSTEPELNSTV